MTSNLTYSMNLKLLPFEQIRSGRKTVELRLFDEKRQRIKVGDRIEFTCGDEMERVEVVALHRADSFRELFCKISPESAGFESGEDYIIMREYYSEEDESRYGVVGIEIKRLV